ncbi:putative NADH:ubiquinone reductase (H(+)-translocating) (mitochondrion) [Arabidopsis thaliana]
MGFCFFLYFSICRFFASKERENKVGFSLILLGVPFPFASNSSTYPEKLSAYECGFDPSGDARSRFDIRFYLVSILFLIPDLEVTFFFPWAVPPNKIDLFGFWSMMAFLFILTIGFLYEWKRGASDRE